MADEQFWFDDAAATRAVDFIEKFCTHVKGELGGSPFILEDWQKNDIIRPMFGWKRKDGRRKYRTCYVEIPRKNGKSNLSAAIALYLLFADNEPGAEVISAAGDRGQANIVFNIAQEMVQNNQALSRRAKVLRTSIEYQSSWYKSISAESYTKHGLNCHGVVFDELHSQKTRDLWDVLTTSTGARRQPLVVALTTAGHDRTSICWEVHEYALAVKSGLIEDDTFLPVVYAADPDDDWTKEETWQKANPGFGSICKREYFEQMVSNAKSNPSMVNTFLRLHLNIWTSAETAWLPDDVWMQGSQEIPWERLPLLKAYGGLDLASTQDLTAFALLFRDDERQLFYLVVHQFVNSEKAHSKKLSAGVDYVMFARDGDLTITPGNVTDYDLVYDHIIEKAKKYDIQSIGYDPKFSAYLVPKLEADGVKMNQMAQNITTMNGPTKEFEMQVMRGNIIHGGNRCLRWQIGCAVVYVDVNENKRVTKEKVESRKVDGVIASIIAMNEYMHCLYNDDDIMLEIMNL
jgi:phage terminase large subunit-like protein